LDEPNPGLFENLSIKPNTKRQIGPSKEIMM
jgi:hypothetical protein